MSAARNVVTKFIGSGASALLLGRNADTGETFQYVSATQFPSAKLARQFFGPAFLKWPVRTIECDEKYCQQFDGLAPFQKAEFRDLPTKKAS